MRTYIEHDRLRRVLKVYVCVEESPDGTRAFATRMGDGQPLIVAPGAEPPLYCEPIPVGDDGPIRLP